MPPIVVALPESLVERIADQADEQGIAPNDLIVSLLSVPLEVVARIHPIKCGTCGVIWTAHSPLCSRHDYRPEWAKEFSP